MILFPAIDIKNGSCVRLVQGKMENVTIFNKDPVNQAKIFELKGCTWIHVIDLDGAVEGRSVNEKIIKRIISSVGLKIQLGGGIRNMKAIDKWFKIGVKKIILGSLIANDPELVKEAIHKYPGKISLGLDFLDDNLAIEGWIKKTNISVKDIAKDYENSKVASFICTNIKKDGAMSGIDLNFFLKNAKLLKKPIIASGGITNLNDLINLKKNEKKGIEGVICGRAIYEGKIDLVEANKIFEKD